MPYQPRWLARVQQLSRTGAACFGTRCGVLRGCVFVPFHISSSISQDVSGMRPACDFFFRGGIVV